MRKLIEMSQEFLIVCDNPSCDFKIQNPTKVVGTDIRKYINVACPECGENLLTDKDYAERLKMLAYINWMNKWFSWLTLFVAKNKKQSQVTVHVHNGINIEK